MGSRPEGRLRIPHPLVRDGSPRLATGRRCGPALRRLLSALRPEGPQGNPDLPAAARRLLLVARPRLDARSTAARHIAFDHMLRWVAPYGAAGWDADFAEFAGDEHGILHEGPRRSRRRPRRWHAESRDSRLAAIELGEIAVGRLV